LFFDGLHRAFLLRERRNQERQTHQRKHGAPQREPKVAHAFPPNMASQGMPLPGREMLLSISLLPPPAKSRLIPDGVYD
jgi:hypothetical protein